MSQIPRFSIGRFQAVAIGSSTGAPGLVQQIVSGLPADLPLPIFIAQHMPPTFTESYATRLQLSSPLTVVHAQNLMPVFAGTAYVGQGHKHLRVCQGRRTRVHIQVSEQPTQLLFKPSADELFRSCAQVYGSGTLAVVMSGIGNDGTEGACHVHDAGGIVITQSAASCAVYGMPRSCVEAGVSYAQLNPDQIRRTILQLSPEHGRKAIV